jgi:hypothetical protein
MNKEALGNFKELSQDGGRQAKFGENPHPAPFYKGLSNETAVS